MSIKTNRTRPQAPPQPPPTPKIQERSSDKAHQSSNEQHHRVQAQDAVSQQAVAHVHGQIQQNKFVDPSQTSQGQGQQLVDSTRGTTPKTGLKRDTTNGALVRDPSQGPNASGFLGNSPFSQAGTEALTQTEGRTTPRDRNPSQTNLTAAGQGNIHAKFGAPPAASGQGNVAAQGANTPKQGPVDPAAPNQVGGGGGDQPLDQQRVDDAYNTVNDALSQGFTDWDVTHGDLDRIQSTLGGLNGQEFNAVMDRMSNEQLSHLSNEMNGAFNGYSPAERREFFDMVAGKANANNLDRLVSNTSNEHDVNAIGEAIAQHAPDQVKADFATQASRNLPADSNKGIAVAQALGGLGDNPALLQSTLQGIGQADLNNVMHQATRESTHVSSSPYGGGHISTSYNAEPLANMLNATANISDPSTKARVFEGAANELGQIDQSGSGLGHTTFKNGSDQMIRDGLTNIMNSDTNGVVNSLESNNRDGQALTSYLQSMVDNGQQQQVGTMINRLMTGNDGSQNAIDRFGEQVPGQHGEPHYKNAQNLGYFMGATQSAIQNITNNTRQQAGLVKDIFNSVIGAGGAFGGTAGGVGSALLGGLTSQTIDAVTDNMVRGHTDLRDSMRRLAYPSTANGVPYEGAAEVPYDAAVGRVIDAHHH